MTLQVDLPDEVLEALGPTPEREILESILLRLVQQERMTVARAGELLGMDRLEAIHWYVAQGFYYPDLGDDELAVELDYADQACPNQPTHKGISISNENELAFGPANGHIDANSKVIAFLE